MLNAMVADDDPAARAEIVGLLQGAEEIHVEAEAGNVREAIECLGSHNIDVAFLDINLPDATGMRLARALQRTANPPEVIFVTAHPDRAVEAFEVGAVDYLVKPVAAERLEQAIERVSKRVALKSRGRNAEWIAATRGSSKVIVPASDILFAEARDDYCSLLTISGRYFCARSLSRLEEQLSGSGFYRTHRGYLVNLSAVEEVEPASGGTLLLALSGYEGKVPVSRRNAAGVKQALGI